jgi:phosphate:Na+ symporter
MAVGLLILPWIEPMLQKLSPPSVESDLSRPQFLLEEALNVPETANALVDHEQRRYFEHCIGLIDTAREDGRGMGQEEARVYHKGAIGLQVEIKDYLAELISRPLESETMHEVLNLQRRQVTLDAMQECLNGIVLLAFASREGTESQLVLAGLLESISLISLTALAAWRDEDEQEHEFLLKLTDDRSDMMERLRKNIRADDAPMSSDEQSSLFYATTLFERGVWLMRQLGLTLCKGREG